MPRSRPPALARGLLALAFGAGLAGAAALGLRSGSPAPAPEPPPPRPVYQPRQPVDTSGFLIFARMLAWPADASLETVASVWRGAGHREVARLDAELARLGPEPSEDRVRAQLMKATFLNYEGEPVRAYEVLEGLRAELADRPWLAADALYTVVYLQGVTALRRGETDNCVLCRGESSCVLPIGPAAVHANPAGSRLAVRHFTEYLAEFPDDADVRWLLNVAHMTLGEHPAGVDPRFAARLDRFNSAEHGIGRFRDVGHRVGVNRFNQAGGAILDDFDNDGRLDVVFTSMDPTAPMAVLRNAGDGTFADRSAEAGVLGQLGGLNCVQADFDNDGFLDVFVCRGAWLTRPVRPSLLRNRGNGTFEDVTDKAGVAAPMNAIAAQWADYDNDGFLDLLVCGERQPNRLYRNRGDGTFEDVAARAGVAGPGRTWKGVAWLDYDRDGFPDLFLTDFNGPARLFRNTGAGAFEDVTAAAGIAGPDGGGFSCWAWDYDNDGWPDLFATSYRFTVGGVAAGLDGARADLPTGRLYRNVGGRFEDVTAAAGLDLLFAAMGSNFADFDNDGFPDFYLGTGDPQFGTLVPNRLFRNLRGRRFVDVTGVSGTGHVQKGHGVACGDWDRDGAADLLVQTGGAAPGDRYHNVLFQNPGQSNRSLTVKLVGKQTNRAAIGARVKVTTPGPDPLTVYRWVSSGSSFGANPLEQLVGLGAADRAAEVEVYWPTSRTTQVFRDVPAGRYLEVTEFAADYTTRAYPRIRLPD